ncbi:DUF3857 domain-containing protein [Formosa sp. 4Alg 33]|uniref:DUF3857 domain-containing protein n=1 Tax=Formosa sp. 4Alg 33 TaxID=3382189 RepID=UPI003D9C0E05
MLSLFFIGLTASLPAQSSFSANPILKATLAKNANVLVKTNAVEIHILNYNKMVIKTHRTVTIYNASGDSKAYAYEPYDSSTKIKTLEATVYDASGNKVKRYKEKDFNDAARADGISIYNDDRIKYLEHQSVSYPYTIDYISEVEHSMTAFLPSWSPLEAYYTSVLHTSYQIINDTDVPLALKEEHFNGYNITKKGDYHFVAEHLKAIKPEAYSPDFYTFAPRLKVAMQTFDMKGVQGINTNWQDFGAWVYESLLADTQELPEGVITTIKALTAEASTNEEKARIVYDYLQKKARYISVQVGIGGWKPMLAKDVDRLSYGDCKALSNYTHALLNVVGVPSYYALIYGGEEIKNIDKDFSSTQGNHAVLTIPSEDGYVWLECTSQKTPFGYIANFTDDRDALIITPEGGKIVHTKIYKTEENLLHTSANIQLHNDGSFDADVEVKSYGTQYRGARGLEEDTEKNQKLRFKDNWDHINDLEIKDVAYSNNKRDIEFTENVSVSARNYGSKSGKRLLLAPNVFNKLVHVPPRYTNRTMPIQIERGFIDTDSYQIHLEDGLAVEALQKDVALETKFGSYYSSIKEEENGSLTYTRKLTYNKGLYPKEDYQAYRDFWITVSKLDNAKIVLLINI